MRFARYFALGLLVTMMSLPAAQADGSTRNFGSTACQQKFSCAGTDSNQLAELANNCSVRGFGISTQQSGIFDGAVLDADNCMTGQLPTPTNGGRSMAPQCCVVPDGDTCSMRCTLLMY